LCSFLADVAGAGAGDGFEESPPIQNWSTYGHLFPEQLQETAAVLDELYGSVAR